MTERGYVQIYSWPAARSDADGAQIPKVLNKGNSSDGTEEDASDAAHVQLYALRALGSTWKSALNASPAVLA